MKSTIHPKWFPDAKITCTCGNSFVTGSTKEQIKVEVCSACHPFFTGQQKYVDTLGRLERFQAKQQATAGKTSVSRRNKKLLKKQGDNIDARPKTLREMFEKVKVAK